MFENVDVRTTDGRMTPGGQSLDFNTYLLLFLRPIDANFILLSMIAYDENIYRVFTICRHGGHLGHVTKPLEQISFTRPTEASYAFGPVPS